MSKHLLNHNHVGIALLDTLDKLHLIAPEHIDFPTGIVQAFRGSFAYAGEWRVLRLKMVNTGKISRSQLQLRLRVSNK